MDSLIVTADDGTDLHVATCGEGPDVVVLSGGPGCVHYLAEEALAPQGFRCWFPDPRGVGRSGGGAHDIPRAVADLEAVRAAVGVSAWLVLGHSWGSDLGLRYALDRPGSVRGLLGIAGHGLHRDREWAAEYQAGKAREEQVPIDWAPAVHESLGIAFRQWIHEPGLWRGIADSPVPMTFLGAQLDIRPDWPLRQLAELAPQGRFEQVEGVGHDFWHSHPAVWREACEAGLRRF